MKKLFLTIACVAVVARAGFAQGTITFANTTLSRVQWCDPASVNYVNVPVGAPIVYGVFWGTAADSLQLNAGPLGTASTTTAGIIAAPSPYIIEGAEPGATVYMKIAGWSSQFQRDFVAAKAASAFGSYYGETSVRSVTLGPTAGPGTVIWSNSDLTKFQPLRICGVLCPEPSVVVLGVLGLGALAFRRRKAATDL